MRPIKFSKKEKGSAVLAFCLALASTRPADPAFFIPMLSGSWAACIYLAFHHQGSKIYRTMFVCAVGIVLAFLGCREMSDHSTATGPSGYTNAQIKDSALALARRMRQLQREQNRKQSQLLLDFQQQLANSPKHKKALVEEWNRQQQAEMTKRMMEIDSETETRFGPLRAEARTIIFHLNNRVPAPEPIPSVLVSIALSTGPLAGPDPISNVADYIEQLAQLVPVSR